MICCICLNIIIIEESDIGNFVSLHGSHISAFVPRVMQQLYPRAHELIALPFIEMRFSACWVDYSYIAKSKKKMIAERPVVNRTSYADEPKKCHKWEN